MNEEKEIQAPTIYDMAKNVYSQMKPLKQSEINDGLRAVHRFVQDREDTYFLLLNRETYDITMFEMNTKETSSTFKNDLEECLSNRGEILSIEQTLDGAAMEIWVRKHPFLTEWLSDDIGLEKADPARENIVFYFFPYDVGVIKVDK